jgi:hypothetical protein
MVGRLWFVLVAALIPLADAACSGPCSCPDSNFESFNFPAELNVTLAAVGAACPYAPLCEQHADGGACTQYTVSFASTGSCMVTATAADGRMVSAIVTVGPLSTAGCCGTIYGVSGPVSLTFDQDASTSGG